MTKHEALMRSRKDRDQEVKAPRLDAIQQEIEATLDVNQE
jgi:hypothetical protein